MHLSFIDIFDLFFRFAVFSFKSEQEILLPFYKALYLARWFDV